VKLSDIGIVEIGTRLGVPFLVLMIVLTQLTPKIDRGIQIADHVDAELQYLALRGCSPPTTSSGPAFLDSTSSGFTSAAPP